MTIVPPGVPGAGLYLDPKIAVLRSTAPLAEGDAPEPLALASGEGEAAVDGAADGLGLAAP
jgi:hypothetical protein